jgi:hypothetical protein
MDNFSIRSEAKKQGDPDRAERPVELHNAAEIREVRT